VSTGKLAGSNKFSCSCTISNWELQRIPSIGTTAKQPSTIQRKARVEGDSISGNDPSSAETLCRLCGNFSGDNLYYLKTPCDVIQQLIAQSNWVGCSHASQEQLIQGYLKLGYMMNIHAKEFLGYFGGLSFDLEIKSKEWRSFSFKETEALSFCEPEDIQRAETKFLKGVQMSPVGSVNSAALLVDQQGRFFVFHYTDLIYYVGTCFQEVLEFEFNQNRRTPDTIPRELAQLPLYGYL